MTSSVTSIIPFRKYSGTNGDPRVAGATKRAGFSRFLWKSGEITWEPLSSIKEDLPYEAAQYAADHDLLREKAIAKWAPYVLRKANRWIRAARRQTKNNLYKFGIEIPWNVAHALELDRKNGNNLWRDAISAEIGTLSDMKVFYSSLGLRLLATTR